MAAAPAQRGLSLVELLVGLAIGLAVLAGAIGALALHGRETLRTWRDARLAQAVAQAGDLIARDLRRAGHWADATRGMRAPEDRSSTPNPYIAIEPADPQAAGPVTFRYARASHPDGTVADNEVFGLRLRGGVIELQLGAGNWQGLTDGTALQVTTLRLAASRQTRPVAPACAVACAVDDPECGPRVAVRDLAVTIEARSVADPSLVRAFHARVRVRADALSGTCPAAPAGPRIAIASAPPAAVRPFPHERAS